VLINEVVEGSPAEIGNITVGDIILAFDKKPVNNVLQLAARIASSYVGKDYVLKILREGEIYESSVTLGALPDRRLEEQYTVRGSNPLTGYVFEPLSPALNEELGLPLKTEGVVVVAMPTQKRWGAVDLRIGDVMLEINGKRIRKMENLKKSTVRRPKAWRLLFKRGGEKHQVIMQ